MYLYSSLADAQEFAYPVVESQGAFAWGWFVASAVLLVSFAAMCIYFMVRAVPYVFLYGIGAVLYLVLIGVWLMSILFTLIAGLASTDLNQNAARENALTESIRENYGAEVVDLYVRRDEPGADVENMDAQLQVDDKKYECVISHDIEREVYSVSCIVGDVVPLEQLSS